MASALLLAADAHGQAAQRVDCGPPGSPGARAAQGMVDASVRAQQREAQVLDAATGNTTQRVTQAGSCLNRVTQAINQQIPSFGGGMLGSIASSMAENLANQACSVAGQAQRQIEHQIGNPPVMSQPSIGSIPINIPGLDQQPSIGSIPINIPGINQAPSGASTGGIVPPANQSGGAIQSVGNLLSGLF